MKIKNFEVKYPIIQGGMGVGISWDQLAGTVSKEGGLGVISAIGTGYYEHKKYAYKLRKGKPSETVNFYSKDALTKIIERARKICGDKPLACNVLYAINDYGRVVKDACEAGINAIITGAGLPTNMPEFTKDFPNVALIPIVSSARALKLICKKWKRYNKLPDAVIVEGPLSGGHQGFSYEDCSKEEFQLENIVPKVLEELKTWGKNIPLFAAGGIWGKKDIDKFIEMGCTGVQMGTRFIGTNECDASPEFKQTIIDSKAEDIQLMSSPVGLPARGVVTNLQKIIKNHTAPKIACVSNCIVPCHRGVEAKKVGYCIADRLSAAYEGDKETGLFFAGANGYKVNKLISVKELIGKLIKGE